MTIHRRAHRMREAAVRELQAVRAALRAAPARAVEMPEGPEIALDPAGPGRARAHPAEALAVPPASREVPVPRAPLALWAAAEAAAVLVAAATEGRHRRR